jgi:hypothetical protein
MKSIGAKRHKIALCRKAAPQAASGRAIEWRGGFQPPSEFRSFAEAIFSQLLPRSKHGERRHIPMNSVLRAILGSLTRFDDCPYVFRPGTPDKWFTALCRAAEILDFTWHCLRHTFASRLVMAGVDIRTVQELLGHKSIVTTMRYAHLVPKHQADAVEQLTASSATATATKTSELSIKSLGELAKQLVAWCGRGESNPHALLERWILSPLRLPFRHFRVVLFILA